MEMCLINLQEGYLLNEDGMPKQPYPTHWKGKDGLYCGGLSGRGLPGVSMDAQMIANDISMLCNIGQT